MDDLPILKARQVLAAVREDLTHHANERLAEFQSQLDRTQADIDNHATYTVINGQAVLNDARKSLDNRVNLILGNAMQTAGIFGVEVPHPDTLRTSRSFPPPEIVAVGTPDQSLAGMDSLAGGGGGQYRPICQVHLLDESIRGAYIWLCRYAGNQISVCPEPISYIAGNVEQIRRYPHWWNAELACRLYNDCHWPLEEVLSYSDAIDATQLWQPGGFADMHQMCEVLPKLFDEWRAWKNPFTQGVGKPSKPQITQITQSQHASGNWYENPLKPGECLEFTEVQPPVGWKRC